MFERTQVAVVGGGPVGVGLALELGLRGVDCVLVERREQLPGIPKGQGLSQRTMEHFHRWGIAEQIRRARTMPSGYQTGMVHAYGDLMSEFWAAPPARSLVKDYYFQENERLPQYATEGVMRRRLAGVASVTTRFGWTAVDVDQDEEGVRIRIERDGVDAVVEADYLVGCDGSRSMVRERVDIQRHGTDWGEVMTLIVFRSQELNEALGRFPALSTYRVMHPDLQGHWMFFGRVDADGQFFFHAPIPPGTDRDDLDVAELLHRAAGFHFSFELDHLGFWDLRVQLAEEYRRERVFLAGDAAHTHPPYGGFGLNTGMEDAVNLGWKLAAVHQGWGGPALLDSYSHERQTVFRILGEDVIGGWIATDREFLMTHHPDQDREAFENQFAEVAKEYGRVFSAVEPNYEGSPVVLGPPGGVTSAVGEHRLAARPGHHLAPRELSTGVNVFEALGDGFTLIALDAVDADVDAVVRAATELRVPLTVARDTFADGREAYAARLVLVRPDQYVAWAGDRAPDDPAAILARVTGHSSGGCAPPR